MNIPKIRYHSKIVEKLIIYTMLFTVAFFYCFGIETFKDNDMHHYFANGFYMANYGIEGVPGYPNQLYSLFLYWGYKFTDNWYGLSNILFLPLYLFGVYSLYAVLNYFIKTNYVSLLFTLLFLLIDIVIHNALYFNSYIVYFFFFISVIYLAIYHPTKICLIAFYFAIGTLFRNQLITFLPFIPFIINPKLSKKYYLKNIAILLLALVIVQLGYEGIKNITMPQKSESVNFSYYFGELNYFLLQNSLFTLNGIKLFLKHNFSHYYFYLVLIPCFFMFNKKFAKSSKHPTKPLLTIFLILALFIYFMPSIMYINKGLDKTEAEYFYLLSRYSFIMIALLIPIYYFIIKEQPFIKLNNIMVYVVMVVILLPVLNLSQAPVFVKNTFTNISHKKELHGIDSTKIKNVLKANFNEKAFFTSNFGTTQIYVGSKAGFIPDYKIKNQNIYNKAFNYNEVDGVILIGKPYPYLVAGDFIYTKIYQENSDEIISIYKKTTN